MSWFFQSEGSRDLHDKCNVVTSIVFSYFDLIKKLAHQNQQFKKPAPLNRS